MFAKVIIDISLEKLDKPFDYKIPDSLKDQVYAGCAVKVPFGKGKRVIKGYVIEITGESSVAPSRIKEIDSVCASSEPLLSRMIKLAAWMKENYGSTMNQALKTVLPVKEQVRSAAVLTVVLTLPEDRIEDKLAEYKRSHAKARIRLLTELAAEREISKDTVIKKLHITGATLNFMLAEGVIALRTDSRYRQPFPAQEKQKTDIVLNSQQKEAAESMILSMRRIFKGEPDSRVHLLHGITGSGKTEVYMELIDACIAEGRQAIVLIPEIALTYQTVKRFTKRFGNSVSIINSKLSKGERYDQFERAKNGDVNIMIGPRSALFTPFKRLGLVIIDEEHETSYKSESVPKYHAREVAQQIVMMSDAMLVLGSATPSLDAYYNAMNGKYQLHTLSVRGRGALSRVHIADLRKELARGNKSVFSGILTDMIKDRLVKKEQVMLFINRRGYAGFVSCRECGAVIKCPHCDVSLKAHKDGSLVCHYCGYRTPLPDRCPSCGSKYIAGFGTGTQKVETIVKRLFPGARTLRMDTDTTSAKGGHEEILSAFANHDADILVGTQMIVKGHDFPLVTLVGVLAADQSLFASDYRAAERTFQLLTQAAGRAGRGDAPGDVVIQTYNPDHYSIVCSKNQDYLSFYQEEIAYRKLLAYPPAAHMTAILMTSFEQKNLDKAVGLVVEKIHKIQEDGDAEGMDVIGPADAGIARINDMYRKVIYLKHTDRRTLVNVKDLLEKFILASTFFNRVNIQFDFDPSGNY